MEVRLDGKVMLITGASTGIGRAIAKEASGSGAMVCVNYFRSEDRARELLKEIQDIVGVEKCLMFRADVSREGEVIEMFESVKRHFGSPPDILVNNAGSMIKRSPISEMEVDLWDRVMETNMRSVFLCSREALKSMIPNRSGVIINISSIAAYTGGGPGSSAYAASKGAMNTFTIGLAKEVAKHNIRVMAVGPGVIETPFHEKFTTKERMKEFEEMIPISRVGRPEDIAPMVIFLASDLSSFTTAHHFDITGGM